MLKPAGYGNAERVVKRFVDAELNDLASESISSPYDVVEHELTQELLEVVQAEVDYRIQGTISEAIQLNQSAAERDLEEIFGVPTPTGTRRSPSTSSTSSSPASRSTRSSSRLHVSGRSSRTRAPRRASGSRGGRCCWRRRCVS